MKAKKLLIAIFLFASAAHAQDPEFSQYYAARKERFCRNLTFAVRKISCNQLKGD